jgi:uridine kinase
MNDVVERIMATREGVPRERAVLVAVSGIDGSGKGYVTGRIVEALGKRGLVAVALNLDAWLALPPVRFSAERPAEHFYRHAVRFDEMFERLVLPLKESRAVRVEADVADETAHAFRRHTFEYHDVDVVVLEGIFLLKPAFRARYDLAFWVECGFDTALVRALRRAQEGLSYDETIHTYRTIYFPAQLIHFALDDPRSLADAIIANDIR